MLDRRIVFPFAPKLLVKRQYEQWRRSLGMGLPRGSQKHTAGYKFECWQCGEEGILGVDGFGSKGPVRIRNIMHTLCYDSLPEETKLRYAHTDRKHEQRMGERRKSRRSVAREAKMEADYQQRLRRIRQRESEER